MDTALNQIKVDFGHMPTGPWVARASHKLVLGPIQHEVMGLGYTQGKRSRGMTHSWHATHSFVPRQDM